MFSLQNNRRQSTRYHRNADINITNLMDVMMVLLVVFMVAAPLMTSGIALDLPKVGGKAMEGEETSINISVDKDGYYTLSSNNGNFAFDVVSGVAQAGYYKAGTKIAVNSNVVANALYMDFSLMNGAQAKLTGNVSGLRFKGQISTEDYNKYSDFIVEIGMAFIPADYLNADGSDFMFENFVIGETISKLALTQAFGLEGGYNVYYGVLGNLSQL